MKKTLLVIGVMLMTWQPLSAKEFTGNDLVRCWKEYKKLDAGQSCSTTDPVFYMGYLRGVAEADPYIYYPKGTTTDQICNVVGKWIDDHPEKWTYAPLDIVNTALKEAFPLRNKKK